MIEKYLGKLSTEALAALLKAMIKEANNGRR